MGRCLVSMDITQRHIRVIGVACKRSLSGL
jgi:hypothetical protein